MNKKASAIILILFLVGSLGLLFDINAVKAEPGTINIRADGSVYPSSAPISNAGNVTYTLTDNINDSIVVERDNIVVDGAGYTVRGTFAPISIGLNLSARNNVTIRNMKIEMFSYGVYLGSSSNCAISSNNITNNYAGVELWSSSNNTVSGNGITANNVGYGVGLHYSSNYNTVSGNNITNNRYGIYLYSSSSYNTVSGNNITLNNYVGVELDSSSNNTLSGNVFVDDGLGVESSYGSVVVDNLVNGKPLVCLEGVSDLAVEDAGQVILVNCNRMRVENLNLSHTAAGVELWNTNSTTISGNNIANNGLGIYLVSSSDNTVSGNNVTASNTGVELDSSSNNNTASGNNITANNYNGIYLDSYSDHNTVSGNNITANTNDGIYLYSSSNNAISGNNMTANGEFGISLFASSGNSLTSNAMSGNAYNFGVDGYVPSDFVNDVDASNTVDGKPVCYWINKVDMIVPSNAGFVALVNCTGITVQNLSLANNYEGIGVIYTSDSTIVGNNVARCGVGIAIANSSKCTVSGNDITNNQYDGVALSSSFDCAVSGNNITNNAESGESGVYLDSPVNCTVSENNIANNYYGVHLTSSSSHNTVSGNNITNNTEDGVYLDSSSNCTVSENNMTNNNYGVYLSYSSNCSVSWNNITNNSYGVALSSSSNCTVTGNNVADNSYYGVWLRSSSNNNRFLHNNFIDNPQQIYIEDSRIQSTDAWDDGYPAGGNYWSNYAGVDLNHGSGQSIAGGDGLCDAAYTIDSNNIDDYPLMAPFKSFSIDWNQQTYSVGTVSSSSISTLSFNATAKTLTFNVTGTNGTIGFCRVAIPMSLMSCARLDDWTVTVNRTQLPLYVNATANGNYTYIYFTYHQSTEIVRITSTNAVPEFQPFLVLPLLMVAPLLAAIFHRRKRDAQDCNPLRVNAN